MKILAAWVILILLLSAGTAAAKKAYVRPHMDSSGRLVNGRYIQPGDHPWTYWYNLQHQQNAQVKEGTAEPWGPVFVPPEDPYFDTEAAPEVESGFPQEQNF